MPLPSVCPWLLRWIAALNLFIVWPLANADQPAPQTLQLHELIQQVISQNAGLDAESLRAQAQSLRTATADDLADPQFMYGLAPRSLGLQDGDEGHVFGLSQQLPWPGKRPQQRLAASAQAEAAHASVQSLQRALLLKTRQAYANWFQRHQEWLDNQKHEAHLKTLEVSARQGLASGQGNQQIALMTQIRVLETQKRGHLLAAELEQVRATLQALRQYEAPLQQTQPGLLPLPAALPDLALLRQGLAQHPQLQQLQAQIQSAEARLRLSELSRWPDPKLQIQHFGVRPREEYRTQLSLSFDLPINQNKRSVQIAAQNAELAALKAEQRELQAQLDMQLTQAVAQWQAAQTNWQLYQQQWLPTARQQVEVTRAQFAAARGDIMSLINAEHDWLNAKTESVRQQTSAFQAYSKILWLSGPLTRLDKE